MGEHGLETGPSGKLFFTVEEKLSDDKQSATPTPPESISVQALITYNSFVEAANAMQWRTVYAELVYKGERWEVKSAEEQTVQSSPVELTINGQPALCLNKSLP
ncbi:MAG: hypothetical protein WHX52_09230 [Anaerolineae bacterium]